MRSETVTTVVPAPQTAVFEYVSDIEKLPEWADSRYCGMVILLVIGGHIPPSPRLRTGQPRSTEVAERPRGWG